jgi:hypothetical protein
MNYQDKQGLICLIVIFCIYLLRKNKPFDMIWLVLKLTIIIAFAIATAGLALAFIKKLFK